jgi:hypothetical protein
MQKRLWLLPALAIASSCGGDEARREIATSGTLTLVRERDLAELLPGKDHYEASGIAFQNGILKVVFDNRTHVAEIDLPLQTATLGAGAKSQSQYEGITIATRPTAKTYIVKEALTDGRGGIVTLDPQGNVVSTEATDIHFPDENKGLEGLAWLDDIERLLVLCEANSCGEGNQSPGHGVIHVLRHEGASWLTESTLTLPSRADFDDYSDVAVMPESEGRYRMAILSQETSALWLGELTTTPLAIEGPGVVYGFPRTGGIVSYCSLEGVTFVDRNTLALVSDRSKGGDGCSKGEAIHVFAVP